MRVITVYDDDREEIITYVSTYDMEGQSIQKGKLRSITKSYIEHTNSYCKQYLTRTHQGVIICLIIGLLKAFDWLFGDLTWW